MKKEKEVILVTGGDGFIASHLVQELGGRGGPVSVFSLGRRDGARVEIPGNRVQFIVQDLLEEEKLGRLLGEINPTTILHFAADTNPDRDPGRIRSLMRGNFDATLNLYTASLRLERLPWIITAGSTGEYEQNTAPFVETQKEMPASPYSFSKTCVTHLSSYFYRIHRLPVVVVRPCAVYGEFQAPTRFIPRLILKCLRNEPVDMTTGDRVRDFLYVKDLVRALLRIMEMTREKKINLAGEIINICTGERTRLKDAALLILKETDSKSTINFGAVPDLESENTEFHGSNDKAKRLLNWVPRFSFEEGIRETIRWFQSRAGEETNPPV